MEDRSDDQQKRGRVAGCQRLPSEPERADSSDAGQLALPVATEEDAELPDGEEEELPEPGSQEEGYYPYIDGND